MKASVGGKLAQIGSRLVDGAARKMADEFFAKFAAELNPTVPGEGEQMEGEQIGVEQGTEAAEQSSAAPTETEAADTQAAQSTKPSDDAPRYEPTGSGFIWVVAFVVLAGAILLAF